MSPGSYEKRWLVGHPLDGCIINISRNLDVVGRCCHVIYVQTAEDWRQYSSAVSFSSPHASAQVIGTGGGETAASLGSILEGAEQQIF